MQVLALTGGIATGKSTIGRRLEELGAVRIDADQLARDAVAAGSPGLARIREHFGDEVIRPDGNLDRAALGARVFADPDDLSVLNSIVHPEVQRLFAQRLDSVRVEDADAIVVYEIPLLAETEGTQGRGTQGTGETSKAGRNTEPAAVSSRKPATASESATSQRDARGTRRRWDLVITAEAPAPLRVERMVEFRGMTRDDARRRIANQASEESRRALADVVIDTSGSESETIAQVDALWSRLRGGVSE